MNIVYSSDENYAQHLCVSLLSLLESSQDDQTLNLFVISNGISEESKAKIVSVTERYQRKINWIDFAPFEKELELDMEWPISISSYARLFICDMLPEWCERAIYLDCDTIICGSLSEMWNTALNNASVAGVEDMVLNEFKEKIGLGASARYINAGVLLIDLAKWRASSVKKQFLDFINAHRGRVIHHDQGTINGVLHKECLLLHPRYNAMTPFFTTKYSRLRKFYQLKRYYSQEEVRSATETPVVIHFTPESVGRVWEYGCKHPKAELYQKYLEQTPWKGRLFQAKRLPVKLRILYWMQKNLPVKLLRLILLLR